MGSGVSRRHNVAGTHDAIWFRYDVLNTFGIHLTELLSIFHGCGSFLGVIATARKPKRHWQSLLGPR